MRTSLLKKYLIMTSAIIVVSFLLMSSVLYVSMSNYWIEEKQESLTASAQSVSSIAARQTTREDTGSYVIGIETRSILTVFSGSNHVDIFITDMEGRILLTSESMDQLDQSRQLSSSVMNSLKNGTYAAVSNLNGLYSEQQYVVGVPLHYEEADGHQSTVGGVFIASTARSFTAFRRDIIQMCVISAIFAAAISFLFSGAMMYQLILPLKEMSAAAVSLGKGDFSRRVRVRSQDEMGELASAFNNMASSLATSETMSRSFVANVSHELKTPMTTIAGFIDGILDGTIPPSQQEHYLKIVSSEVKRLSRLVRSMLALSRIDSGKMQLRRADFNIKDIVINTLLSYENLIDQRKINVQGLENCADVCVNGDPDMIHQVVYNLVENAVKFVDDGGTIRVGIEQKNGNAIVRIRNTGAGIAPEELPLIFDRFYKTDKSRSHDKNGMGLGLFIVKTILQLHGGDITVRSTVNEFCEFEFSLPINIQPPRTVTPNGSRKESIR